MSFDEYVGKNYFKIKNIQVILPGPIYKILEYNKRVIVLVNWGEMSSDQPQESNTNVFAFDQEGKRLWRIEELPSSSTHKNYTEIWIDAESDLMAYNSIGYECKIDPFTGKIYVDPNQRPW